MCDDRERGTNSEGWWQWQHPPPPLRATACRVDMGCWGGNMMGGWLTAQRNRGSQVRRGLPRQGACLLCVAIYFVFSFFCSYFCHSIYHRIREYIYLLHTITSLKTMRRYILPILVPTHEINFTKLFEVEFEYAEHLPALPRTMQNAFLLLFGYFCFPGCSW